jgi:pimeloyl-ACP methyl ester carboxylesterase
MAYAYSATRFDVTHQVPSLSGPLSIAAWVFIPLSLPTRTSPVILICFPGGSFTKAYYHLDVPGFPSGAYSFARHMAEKGYIVVAFDHLGVGESTWPPDGTALTLDVAVQASAAMTKQVRTRWSDGSLLGGGASQEEVMLVGIGHSMGAALLLAQQAEHGSFDALALLGHTNRELHLQELAKRLADSLDMQLDEQSSITTVFAQMYQGSEQGYVHVDRNITRILFHATDVPDSVIRADDAVATHIPGKLLQTLSDPGYKVPLAARIEVPVFLGNGDFDVSTDLRAEPAVFPLARDITLFQLAGSAHCHNFATTRVLLWDRLVRWIEAIKPI